jgi:hypothetical protein
MRDGLEDVYGNVFSLVRAIYAGAVVETKQWWVGWWAQQRDSGSFSLHAPA